MRRELSTDRPSTRRAWRAFSPRDGRVIERRLRAAEASSCPLCGEVLEARPSTRLARQLVLDAYGYDLDCRTCRRFWAVIVHSERSLRFLRMRRLVAAVRAVHVESPTMDATVAPGAA
jgi:hypothetical protein